MVQNNVTVNTFKTCKLNETFLDLYGHKSSTKPAYKMSSLKRGNKEHEGGEDVEDMEMPCMEDEKTKGACPHSNPDLARERDDRKRHWNYNKINKH